MEYDGIAEVWVDSLDDWKQVVADTDFVKYIAGNKKNPRVNLQQKLI